MVFLEVIFPIVVIITVGFVADKLNQGLDLKTLSRSALFIFSPALIFTSLLRTTITAADAGNMFIFSLTITAALYVVSFVAGRLLKLGPADQSGLYLATLFPNAGNYGIPIALFAFGAAGMEREVLMLVFQNLLVNTVGVFIANSSHLDWKGALRKVFQLPPIYAVSLAFLFRILHIELDPFITKPLELMGQATVPLFLFTLGLQLNRTKLERHVGYISLATVIRLVISPLLGIVLVQLMGITGLTGKIVVLAFSLPTAVSPTLYAIEFNAAPAKVSAVTLVTTVLGTLTVTALLWGWLL